MSWPNRTLFIPIGILAALIGFGLAHLKHDTEPWSTISDFLVGGGLILSISHLAQRNKKT